MAANFPGTPTIGDTVTIENVTYRWTGTTWTIVFGGILTAVVQSNNGTIDLSKGNYHKIAIDSGNATVTVSFTNVSSGSSKWFLELDVSASYTITWPASVIWEADTAPATIGSQTLILEFYTSDSGTNIYGVESINKDNTPPYSFQGSVSGYTSGGYSSTLSNIIDKFSFATDGNPASLPSDGESPSPVAGVSDASFGAASSPAETPNSSEDFTEGSSSVADGACGLDSGKSPRAAASHRARNVAGSSRPRASTAPRRRSEPAVSFTPSLVRAGVPSWSSVRSVTARSSSPPARTQNVNVLASRTATRTVARRIIVCAARGAQPELKERGTCCLHTLFINIHTNSYMSYLWLTSMAAVTGAQRQGIPRISWGSSTRVVLPSKVSI